MLINVQASTLTALVLCQRFFKLKRHVVVCQYVTIRSVSLRVLSSRCPFNSFSQFDAQIIAGACVLISTKASVARRVDSLESRTTSRLSNSGRGRLLFGMCVSLCMNVSEQSCEMPRALRSVVNAVHAVASDSNVPLGTGSVRTMCRLQTSTNEAESARGLFSWLHQRYSDLKMALINAEQTTLRVLGFDIDVPTPLTFLLSYAQQLQYVRAIVVHDTQVAYSAPLMVDALVHTQLLGRDRAVRSQTGNRCVL